MQCLWLLLCHCSHRIFRFLEIFRTLVMWFGLSVLPLNTSYWLCNCCGQITFITGALASSCLWLPSSHHHGAIQYHCDQRNSNMQSSTNVFERCDPCNQTQCPLQTWDLPTMVSMPRSRGGSHLHSWSRVDWSLWGPSERPKARIWLWRVYMWLCVHSIHRVNYMVDFLCKLLKWKWVLPLHCVMCHLHKTLSSWCSTCT